MLDEAINLKVGARGSAAWWVQGTRLISEHRTRSLNFVILRRITRMRDVS